MKDINDVIKENEKLVYYVIKKYFPKEMTDEDIFQEGLIGLWEAITKFDETKGFKFETFAIACIKLKIARAIQRRSYKLRAEDENLVYDTEETSVMDMLKDGTSRVDFNIALEEIWEEFDETERKIVNLKARDKKEKDIAEVLNITPRSVRRRTRTIKDKFREVI